MLKTSFCCLLIPFWNLVLSIPLFCQVSPQGAPAAALDDKACAGEAQEAVQRRDYEGAKAVLRKAIASGHDCADAHFLLAYVLLRQDLPKDSLAEYTLAAEQRTPSAEDLRNVALDYVLLNDYADAGRWALRSLESDKNDPETWYVLGRIKYSTGDFHSAVDCFQHSLALAPKSVKAQNNLGLAFEGLNEAEKAIDAYHAAIALQLNSTPQSEQPLLNLAALLIHRSQLEEALPLLLQAAVIAPAEPRVHEQLGQLYTRRQDFADARREYEKAVSLAPSDPRLHFLLGQAYRHSEMNKEAEQEFATAARLNGTHSTPQP